MNPHHQPRSVIETLGEVVATAASSLLRPGSALRCQDISCLVYHHGNLKTSVVSHANQVGSLEVKTYSG